jgi:hypothetical protein
MFTIHIPFSIINKMAEQNWQLTLRNLNEKSKFSYERAVEVYKVFCLENGLVDEDILISLDVYIKCMHEKFNNVGEVGGFSPSTLWTINSEISSWFLNRHGKHIDQLLPCIRKNLKQWMKPHEPKQSSVLEVDQWENYQKNAPNDKDHLPRKVSSILGVYGLLRRQELSEIRFSDLLFQADCIF